MAAPLHVQLDTPLPPSLAVGAGTALFVAGWCAERVETLALLVDGEPQPLTAHGMPRLDVLRGLRPEEDPYGAGSPDGYRSGFWGTAAIGPRAPGDVVTIGLRSDRGDVGLGAVDVVALPGPVALPAAVDGDGPLVAICIATYEPPAELLRRQLDSIRAQTHGHWVCVISDDGSSAEGRAVVRDAVGDDPRFVVTDSGGRLGFYRNFERVLALAPAEAPFVALADQDDEWHPDKLEALLSGIGDAELVYSDARVVTPEGAVLAETYWERRRNNHADLLSLLVANAVTGAASLLRRELLADALPFPPGQFAHFHDHWLGLVALARGDVAYVDRPLYDYVQHGEASLGHAAANRMPSLRDRFGAVRRDPRERVRQWRMHYFVDVCRLVQVVTVLRLRVGERMAPPKRRALARFTTAETSLPALGRLWLRGARELTGRPETLGAEWMLGYAFMWRRLLRATARDRPARRVRLDAVPPPTLHQPPGRGGPTLPELRVVEEKILPLRLTAGDQPGAPRVNLLVPTIDLAHFFGGYIGKFNLARRLAERGVRVRIVTVDPVPPLPAGWQRTIEAYDGLEGFFDRVEVTFGRESGPVEASADDRWIASTWWTAHLADAAVRELRSAPFLYLVQEYEPFTFPMGTWAALAEASYRFEHRALFSTELLRDFFRRRGLGVFAAGADAGDTASAAFRNAITPVRPPTATELAARTQRRLLFYARPEAHAARNLFELGTLALREASRRGLLRGWALRGVGTTALGRRLDLGTGKTLELLPRSGQAAYGELLREHDVGLALMHTPHPSLVPIEMASAGMVTVTSAFENKTPAAMAAISANLRAAEPAIEPLVAALGGAVAAAADVQARVAGSAVDWPRDWAAAFDDAVLDRVETLLSLPG